MEVVVGHGSPMLHKFLCLNAIVSFEGNELMDLDKGSCAFKAPCYTKEIIIACHNRRGSDRICGGSDGTEGGEVDRGSTGANSIVMYEGCKKLWHI